MSSLKTSGGVGCGGKMSGEVCIFSANIHLDAVSRTATFQVSRLSLDDGDGDGKGKVLRRCLFHIYGQESCFVAYRTVLDLYRVEYCQSIAYGLQKLHVQLGQPQ